jgi:two-component system response regulator YesN
VSTIKFESARLRLEDAMIAPRYSFLLKLMLFTILISTMPLLFLGIFSYLKSTAIVQTKVNEANVFILQQSQNRVEQILKVIDQVAGRYIETPLVVNSVSRHLEVDDFQDVYKLVTGLLGVQTYELGVKDVELHSLQNEWYIKDGGFHMGEDKLSGVSPPNLFYNSGWTASAAGEPFMGIRLIKTIPANIASPKGYLSVRVSNAELSKLLTDGFSSGETMILDEQMRIIIDHNSDRLGTSITAEPWSHYLRETEDTQGFFNSTSLGKPISVVYNHSRYNRWTYVSIIPLQEATQESAAIGWATLSACLVLLLFTAGLSYWGSRRMYFPIRSLMEFTMRLSKPGGQGERAKDELHWIGTQMASWHQTKEQLEGQMKTQAVQLQDYFALKLLQGELQRSEIEDKVAQYHLPLWSKHAVLAMQIDTLEGTRYSSQEQDLLLFAINNIASELIAYPDRVNALPIGNYQVILVGSDVEDQRKLQTYLSGLAEKVQKAVAEYLNLKVSIGISRPYDHLYKTPVAFREAKEALQYRIRLGEEVILHLDDIKPSQTSRHYYPHRLVTELIQSIAFSDPTKANELLVQFIQEVLSVETDPNRYRMSFAMLLTELLRFAYDMGESAIIQLSQGESSEYERMFSLKTPQEIEGWFKYEIINPIMELARKQHESSSKSISSEVTDIIHDYFDSDLTLDLCAQKMNYSTHYIRRMFRKQMGMNFSDYLAQHRHEKAKTWLNETEMKISEIAERLQYTNAQNFIRHFRKFEGMTPGQFREQRIKELG